MWSAINLSLIVLLLLIGQPIYGQTPLDSTYQWAEMEDSVSGMTMKLVDHPEVLLKRCLWRLEADSKVKHSKRQYRIKNVYGKNSLYPGVSATAIMTVENDNGLTLTGPSARNKYSKIHIETPYTLRDDDVANIQFIFYRLEAAITFLHRGLRKYENNEILPYYDGLIEFHDITAYSIEDEKGRGVYRIDFIERKLDEKNFAAKDQAISFRHRYYFDLKSLRLIQYRTDSMHKDGTIGCYRNDYGEEYGAPILTKSQAFRITGNHITKRHIYTLMDDEKSNPENEPQDSSKIP